MIAPVQMKVYIILFRGINVGGNNPLPMRELKSLLETEGYGNVTTYIQSGNVVLTSNSNPQANITAKVKSRFGFKPEVLVLEKTGLLKAIKANPFSSFEGKTVHFYFCANRPKLNLQKLGSIADNKEEYQLHGKVFYLHAPKGIGRSRLVSNIEACLGVPATGRNLNTVLKLGEMAQEVN